MIDLRSKARRRALAYFFTNPTARVHLRELARQLDVDPTNLSRELNHLEARGLFQAEVEGRQKYYRLNRSYALLRELRGIVTKTIGAIALLRDALGKLSGIEEAWLYGSFAQNQQDAASDIDVLIVGKPPANSLASAMRALEKRLGREIHYTVLPRKDLQARRRRKDAFLADVFSKKRIALVRAA